MSSTGCQGTNAEGAPCGSRIADGRQWCQAHDPDPERHAEFLALQSERGRTPRQKPVLPTLTEEQSLRTTEAQLGACERVYLAADLKGDLAIQLKAVAEARAILKAAELEKSNAELVALLLELKPALRTHPALKGHLRSV